MTQTIRLLALLACLALAAGCGNRMWQDTKKTAGDGFNYVFDTAPTTRSYHDESSVPIIEINHNAANVLYSNIGPSELSKKSPVYVRPFTDKNNPADTAPFGLVVMEQVADRLVQRGVLVTQGEPGPDAFMTPRDVDPALYRNPPQGSLENLPPRSAVLAGSYVIGDNYVYMTARIIRLDDHAVVSGHNWTIPITDNVRELLPQLRQDNGLEPSVKSKFD
ncbi:FlgO family outer membrane protein [Pseudodesulfovibrio sp.]|uniref:FlgO family outer membrane protein n=1 Tax=Pseudodesulfovibrio sp. TaxID=2035812 RepID=UPI0026256CAB|nr:FlgO family outer membrane protein [Pseudodesulfovibrio sp.]MDD3312755.1 FlgO family outer membrane protein [Pseudodesulfovibrio sp.]